MSNSSAIICEFNPLHTGHTTLLSHVKSSGKLVICIMSGNFTQRSECAVYDKYTRAELTIRAGADLVFELPFPYSASSAEFFARTGVFLGYSIGADSFTFGSESGDISTLKKAANALGSDSFTERFELESKVAGAAISFDKLMSEEGYNILSNDKLGIYYINEAKKLGYDISFEAFTRISDKQIYRSASDIREMLYSADDSAVKFMADVFDGSVALSPHIDPESLSYLEYLHFRLYGGDDNIFECSDGIRERLVKAARESADSSDFFKNAATKRYTDSRLRRAALFSLIGVKESDVRTLPKFTLLLGASKKGREYLSETRKAEDFYKIITKPADILSLPDEFKRQAELMIKADEVYSLCMKNPTKSGEFLRRSPYIEK